MMSAPTVRSTGRAGPLTEGRPGAAHLHPQEAEVGIRR
jgi:hypothetical protein